jgi:hypothetical protein
MLVVKATPEFEAGTFPDAAFDAEAAKYLSDLTAAGALVAADRLQPSSYVKRVHYKRAKNTRIDPHYMPLCFFAFFAPLR